MDSTALTYEQKWYEIGDADSLRFALAYGVIAMATIWTLENLVHRMLFSSTLTISVSETAALLAFKGSSWFDIIHWCNNKSLFGTSRSAASGQVRRLNRKTIVAIFLRVVVILLDLAIIFAAVPRTITISEKDVGSSQLNFKGQGVKLFEGGGTDSILTPCRSDRLVYAGFNPTASRQICLHVYALNSRPRLNAIRKRLLRDLPERTELIMLQYFNTTNALAVFSFRENIVSSFEHNLRVSLPNRSEGTGLLLRLPHPPDIIPQFQDAILRKPLMKKKCKTLNSDSKNTRFLICPSLSLNESCLFSLHLQFHVINEMYTMKIPANPVKLTQAQNRTNGFEPVGTLNRPRICVIPALIILVALTIINFVVIFVFGEENLHAKLFHLTKEVGKADPHLNPLFVEERRIDLFPDSDDGIEHTSYLGSEPR